ncbi:MAG: hypothetical protein K0S71_218 [Clostridia bacterium]|jgi:hypothetical protein|nr:hypothetical protein [Clostridia bacterium]
MAHSSKNISLSEYLKEVDQKNILVPQFQRNFVWSKGQMVKLAASLLKGYPIGSFLLMQETGMYSSRYITGFETENDDVVVQNSNNSNALLILDGQQRTTSIYQIFYGKGEWRFYINFKQFIEDVKDVKSEGLSGIIEDNIEDWISVFKLEDISSRNPGNNPDLQRALGLFPLDIIFNGGDQGYSTWLDNYCMSNALNANKQIDPEKFSLLSRCKEIFIKRLVESLTSYQASEIVIDKNTSPNIICTIFETINSTGQPLTVLDLLNAKCFAHKFFLRNELEDAYAKYEIFSNYNDKNDSIGLAIVRTIGLLCKKSCKKSDLLNLTAIEIKDNWDKAVEYTKYALEYIKVNYGVLGIQYFPYKDMLPVIAIIVNSDKFKDSPNNKRKLDKWYWSVVFSGYYDNATETKNGRTLKEFLGTEKDKGWFDDDALVPEVVANQAYLGDLYNSLDNLSATRSAQYKAILNLYTLNGAKDFYKTRATIYSMKERDIEDHHIFPRKFLSLNGLKGNSVNTILNRTLISKVANEKIKDAQPKTYFNDIDTMGTPYAKAEYRLHYLDDKFLNSDFSLGMYEEFKQRRKEDIMKTIKSKLS